AQGPLAPAAAVAALRHRVERLRRDPRPVARGAQPAPDHRLAAPAAVRVGGVDPADPEPVGRVEQREHLLLRGTHAEVLRIRAEAAERASADRDAVDHAAILGPERIGVPQTRRERWPSKSLRCRTTMPRWSPTSTSRRCGSTTTSTIRPT